MHYVIIGAGPAGVVATDTIHRLDPRARVTLIGDEPEPPYSRMAIPYFLSNMIGEEGTYLRRDPDHFSRAGTRVLRKRVASVSTSTRKLKIERGAAVSYGKLLVATGSTPVRPRIEGIDLDRVHACWTLADARRIAELADTGKKVVLIGAGFVGCIILEALALRGVNLTVVELVNWMAPRMMNEGAGGILKRWCAHKGVKVRTSTEVTGIERGRGKFPLKVRLNSGPGLPADLVILATGVKPNTSFLTQSGIRTRQGVVVGRYLETSVPDVYAAGDVALGADLVTGKPQVQAIQPTAVEQGRLAATNMVRGNTLASRGNLNMNVLHTLGLVSSSFGLWSGTENGEEIEVSDPKNFKYLNLRFQEDVLVGASSVGLAMPHVGILRGLIQGKVRLREWKTRLERNPTLLMEAYLACAHGPNSRFEA